ncbi:hypothetical protein [Aquibacillus salsiterrae]|uniref:Uncharacterized protein n=1 Tax=Aquibacillus salsiterrae TaxID=2950439 RepID=A0A9X4AGS9_9BACI|nr:hypothetical protein [Aquibacillus salsiterrae]MDC3417458.1 hypothetical protein [Aquibacillus salsiterrae]
MKINQYISVIILSFTIFLTTSITAQAKHAKAIDISLTTYPIFIYIAIALWLILLYVIFTLLKINRLLKQNLSASDKERFLYKRRFYFIFIIMLVIGILSLLMIYVFLYMIAQSSH